MQAVKRKMVIFQIKMKNKAFKKGVVHESNAAWTTEVQLLQALSLLPPKLQARVTALKVNPAGGAASVYTTSPTVHRADDVVKGESSAAGQPMRCSGRSLRRGLPGSIGEYV